MVIFHEAGNQSSSRRFGDGAWRGHVQGENRDWGTSREAKCTAQAGPLLALALGPVHTDSGCYRGLIIHDCMHMQI
jgi:hypothetical protein